MCSCEAGTVKCNKLAHKWHQYTQPQRQSNLTSTADKSIQVLWYFTNIPSLTRIRWSANTKTSKLDSVWSHAHRVSRGRRQMTLQAACSWACSWDSLQLSLQWRQPRHSRVLPTVTIGVGSCMPARRLHVVPTTTAVGSVLGKTGRSVHSVHTSGPYTSSIYTIYFV